MNISLTVTRRYFFCGSFLLVMLHVGVRCAVMSVPCSLVVTCWEKADLLAVACVVFPCVLSLSQMCPGPHQSWGRGWRCETGLSTPVKYFTDRSKAVLFCGSFMFLFCLVFAMSLYASVYMCFVVTFWERADLLALVCRVEL